MQAGIKQKGKTKMTLYELTRQESGIILFTSGEIIVTNWSQCDDDYIPHLSPFGTVMNWPCEGIFDNLPLTVEAAHMKLAAFTAHAATATKPNSISFFIFIFLVS